MRITPHDIRQQQFSSKMFKGYDPQEVDAFLDDVAEDYEAVLKEVALLKEQIAAQEERARGVTERERTLQDTLVTTQRLVEEMKNNARREAELILREAELSGEKAVEAARGEEGKIRADIMTLKRTRRQLVEEVMATLERYHRILAADLPPGEADASAP
ncbi:MAG: cell division protein DivIVA [Candidatus Rokuibacteriota bacterium]|jgi:cell division initiation protein|nr:MAG: cell division protein DivIVA [Candidatus Rokubacteria bacterium]